MNHWLQANVTDYLPFQKLCLYRVSKKTPICGKKRDNREKKCQLKLLPFWSFVHGPFITLNIKFHELKVGCFMIHGQMLHFLRTPYNLIMKKSQVMVEFLLVVDVVQLVSCQSSCNVRNFDENMFFPERMGFPIRRNIVSWVLTGSRMFRAS